MLEEDFFLKNVFSHELQTHDNYPKVVRFGTGGKTMENGGVKITQGDIANKVLEVAIQPGKVSLSQWEQIANSMNYAKEQGIKFDLKFFK